MPYLPEDEKLQHLQVSCEISVRDVARGINATVNLDLSEEQILGQTVATVGAYIQRNSYEALQVALQQLYKARESPASATND